MNGLVDAVRAKLNPSCIVDSIVKGRCGVSLADAPRPHVIVDLDEAGSPLGPTQTKCGFLFFADLDNLAMPIEIKDSVPNVVQATRQLQAGARAADRLAPRDLDIVLQPVLVSKSMRRKQGFELRKQRVQFRRRPKRIQRVSCETQLTAAIEGS